MQKFSEFMTESKSLPMTDKINKSEFADLIRKHQEMAERGRVVNSDARGYINMHKGKESTAAWVERLEASSVANSAVHRENLTFWNDLLKGKYTAASAVAMSDELVKKAAAAKTLEVASRNKR